MSHRISLALGANNSFTCPICLNPNLAPTEITKSASLSIIFATLFPYVPIKPILYSSWQKENRKGNVFTVIGRALDDIGEDMSQSPSNFLRDAVSTAVVVGLAPVSVVLLLI